MMRGFKKFVCILAASIVLVSFGACGGGLPGGSDSTVTEPPVEYRPIKVVFDGDSVTDMYRNREDETDLGTGWPKFAAAMLSEAYPEAVYRNKAVSGQDIFQLQARWDATLDEAPDVLAILIGFNNAWRNCFNDATGWFPDYTFDRYKAAYVDLIDRARAKNPNVRIVILESFLIPVPDEELLETGYDFRFTKRQVRTYLDGYIDAVRETAREKRVDALIPLDGMFAKACLKEEPTAFSADGAHPTDAGATLIARAFAEEFRTIAVRTPLTEGEMR